MSDESSNGQSTKEKAKPTCFVVSPIGAAGSPERKHANVTLRFIIEPVLVQRCGFQSPLRADTLGEPGIISRQIISQLLNADLVIADLTGRNPNVFYELAIRHGTGKPFVQLISKGEVLPFDVGHQRTIFFDRTDLEDVEECKAELERQVKAVMANGFKVETPIGQTLDYEKLRSGGGVEQALAKLADQLTSMNNRDVRVAANARVNNLRRATLLALGAEGPQGAQGAQGQVWIDGAAGHPLQVLVHERVMRYLNQQGFQASPPTALEQEILAAVREIVATEGRVTPDAIDGIVSSVLWAKLISPIQSGP